MILAADIVSTHADSGFPPFDLSFFSSHVFWLVFFFALFYWVIASVIAPQISSTVEKRQKAVYNNLQSASCLKKEIDVLQLEHAKKLQEARSYARNIMTVATNQVRAESKNERLRADCLLDSQLDKVESRIANARDIALQNIEDAIVQIVTEVVRKFTNHSPNKIVVLEAIKNVRK